MNETQKNKLFGQIAIKLGYVTVDDITNALIKQETDEITGTKKHIGTYFFEDKLLTKEQISQILQLQRKYIEKLEENSKPDSESFNNQSSDQEHTQQVDTNNSSPNTYESSFSETNQSSSTDNIDNNKPAEVTESDSKISDRINEAKTKFNNAFIKINELIRNRYALTGTVFALFLIMYMFWPDTSNPIDEAKANLSKLGFSYSNDDDFLKALESGNTKVAYYFLKAGKNLKTNNIGSKALGKVVSTGNEKAVKWLLKKGANVNYRDDNGSTSLITAAEKGQEKIIELLLNQGADLNTKNNKGYTALIIAAINEKDKVVELLLNKGIDKYAKDDKGYTALDWANTEYTHGNEKSSAYRNIIKMLKAPTYVKTEAINVSNNQANNTPQPLPNNQKQNVDEKNNEPKYFRTVSYWNEWVALIKQHDSSVSSLNPAEKVQDSKDFATADYLLAEKSLNIAQLKVDPEVIQLVIEFSAYYKEKASGWKRQAEVLEAGINIQCRSAVSFFMAATATDKYQLQMVDSENNQNNAMIEELKIAAKQLYSYMQNLSDKYDKLKLKRDLLRVKIIDQYNQQIDNI